MVALRNILSLRTRSGRIRRAVLVAAAWVGDPDAALFPVCVRAGADRCGGAP